jgi:lipoyl(octanoyl) transferase
MQVPASHHRIERTASRGSLEVHLLGLVDHASCHALQERMAFDIAGRNDTQGAMLICEHPPVITIGREGHALDVLADERTLEACDIEVKWIARGGKCFIHAPGQLSIYLLLPLDRLGFSLPGFRERLESAVIDLCRELKVVAKRRPEVPGVWGRAGELAHFGAGVRNWVTYGGIHLNIRPESCFLKLVDSNGLGIRAASLEGTLQRPVGDAVVRLALIEYICAQFGYNRHHVHTGHPLLKRTRRLVCQHV